MMRRRVLLSVGLALLLLATSARGDEAPPPPPVDPVEVGSLLLSPDEALRERGVLLLLRRLAQGGDLRPFLRAMAKAQANLSQPAPPQQGVQGETLAGEARRQLDRLLRGAGALRERLATDESRARPAAPAPSPPSAVPVAPVAPEAPSASPVQRSSTTEVVLVRAEAVQIPNAEFESWRAEQEDGGPLATIPPTLVGEEARALLAAAAALPGAEPLFESRVPLGTDATDLLRPQSVSYRQGVRRTKGGAYALRSGRIPEGLQILGWASREKEAPLTVRIQVRHTDVPRPVAVTRVRPAKDVNPIEVDNPEWRTASAELTHRVERGQALAFTFPGVVPGKVVVIGVELP